MGRVPTVDPDASLLRRIQKLLDKAARTTNPHEADAFAAKAARLLAEHRIDPKRLSDAAAAADDLVLRDVPLGRGAYVRARLALLMAIAGANDVRVVFRATSSGTIAHVAGFTSDVDLVTMMYQSLHQQAAAHLATIRRGTAAATQRFRRSFLFGFADRIGVLLDEARATTEAEAPAESSRVTSLALQARADRVDRFAAESFGRTRSARAPSAAQADAWMTGASAADRADIGRSRLTGRPAIGRGARR